MKYPWRTHRIYMRLPLCRQYYTLSCVATIDCRSERSRHNLPILEQAIGEYIEPTAVSTDRTVGPSGILLKIRH